MSMYDFFTFFTIFGMVMAVTFELKI